MIENIDHLIHKELKNRFDSLLNSEPVLRKIISDINTDRVFILGGFVRDVINGGNSRDLDLLVDVSARELDIILRKNNCGVFCNRLGGAKLTFGQMEVDVWSIENNWAFKNQLVKLNEKDKLHSIAKGCFFNYDALVVSLPEYFFDIRFYQDFVRNNELDIIQKRPIYKKQNPTVEANIIRAVYIQKTQQIRFSKNLIDYLYNEVLALNDLYGDALRRIMMIKQQYPKYSKVSEEDMKNAIQGLFDSQQASLFDEENKCVFLVS